MLRVQVCGGVVVVAEDRPLPDALLAGRQGRLVLAYLLCEQHRSVPREELAELLWSEQLPASWTVSLSAIISKLRRLLTEAGLDGVATLASAFGSYRLRLPEDAWVDWEVAVTGVEQAERALRDRAAEAAIEAAAVAEVIVGRGFLTDDSPWVDVQRERLRDLHVRALQARGEAHLVVGDGGRAVEAARRALEIDDLRESGYRLLMRALAADGERGEALRVWERCRAILADELGTDPSPDTEAVFLSILGDGLPDGARDTAGRRVHNIPTFRTALIGREAERKEVAALLTQRRLVTISGPGGVGKTRLAVEAASVVGDNFSGGLWFVDLLGVEEGADVPSALARALDVRSVADVDDQTAVCSHLGTRRVLLLVDNCEHVIEAAATAVDRILDACPAVTVLATSRVPLGVYGEQLLRVAPLPFPPAEDCDAVSIVDYDAVRLFEDRARLVRPDFALFGGLTEVAGICRRLDGMPLAIELAAARAGSLDLAEIARRLDDRFSILRRRAGSGRRGKDSLREVLAWSYDLLRESDRRCFRRLGVFVDGFTLDAAAAMVGGDAAEVVGRLVDHSLVEFEAARQGRYRLLDSLRAFALARLQERSELDDVGRRHLNFFVTVIERGAAALGGPEQVAWLDSVAPEHPNVAAALSFSYEHGEGRLLARLALAMREFWEVAGRYREAQRWLHAALDASAESSEERARALAAAASTAHMLGDQEEARRLGHEALELGERLGDDIAISEACVALARTTVLRADFPAAVAFAQRGIDAGERADAWRAVVEAKRTLALVHSIAGNFGLLVDLDEQIAAVCAEHGDTGGLGSALADLGVAMIDVERVAEARVYLTRALDLHRRVGHRLAIALCLGNLGYVALVSGNLEEAIARNEEALVIAEDVGHAMCITFVLNNLAETAAALGDSTTAKRRYRECMSRARHLGQLDRICLSADGLGALALTDGDAAPAVRLLSAAATARERRGITLEHRYQLANERVLVACREHIGAAEFNIQWMAGRSLDLMTAATAI